MLEHANLGPAVWSMTVAEVGLLAQRLRVPITDLLPEIPSRQLPKRR